MVAPFHINDNMPSEQEIATAVVRLRSGKLPGPTGLRAEDLKAWLAAAQQEEEPDRRNWETLVSLVQHAFLTGELPTEVSWSALVLIPKSGGGHQGIGLLEVIWKLISSIIDARIKSSVDFHDSLHGFRAGRGTSTAIIEAKLLQQLAAIEQVPLYEIFLDLKKAYDALDRERTLEILKGYGVGPAVLRLLCNFWERQQVVSKMGSYHGDAFQAERGVTQGDIVSPTIFNVVVDTIIRYWLTLVSDDGRDAVEGFSVQVRERQTLFYADDGFLASRSPEFLQQAFTCLIGLFERVGLQTNVDKTKTMTCFPGYIGGRMLSPAYKRRMTGEGESIRDRQRRRVECPQCGTPLHSGSLLQHMRSLHGLESVIQPDDAAPAPPATYRISFPSYMDYVPCPVEGCVGGATTRCKLREHFARRHVQDTIIIREEGRLPRCRLCDMFVSHLALIQGHQNTRICWELADLKRQ